MAVKGIVKFREDKCKGCELCISSCPKKILGIRESAVNSMGYHPAGIIDPEGCIGCANCAMMCPDGAISIAKADQGGQK